MAEESPDGMRSQQRTGGTSLLVWLLGAVLVVGIGYMLMQRVGPDEEDEEASSDTPQTMESFRRTRRSTDLIKIDPLAQQGIEYLHKLTEQEEETPEAKRQRAINEFRSKQQSPAFGQKGSTFDPKTYLLEMRNKAKEKITQRNQQMDERHGQVESNIVDTAHTNVLHKNFNRIIAGTIIPVKALSPMDSTIGGPIMLRVEENVYGAVGEQALVTKGSTIMASYGRGASRSQWRLPAQVERMLIRRELVNGDVVLVEANVESNVSDALGVPGIPGKLNTFFKERLANAVIYSLIGAGASLVDTGGSGSSGSLSSSSASEDYKSDITEAFANTAEQEVQSQSDQYENVLTVPMGQGQKLTVMLTRDILFKEMPNVTPVDERH